VGDLTYVSIDPGGSDSGRTIGVVAWDESGLPLKMEQYNKDELNEFLFNLQEVKDTLKVIIYEGYRVFSHKLEVHRNQKMKTSECIGRIQFAAKILGVPVVEQPSKILSTAEKWSGVKLPSNHAQSHQVSAYLHGYFYLHRRNVIQARVLQRIKSGTDSKLVPEGFGPDEEISLPNPGDDSLG
jgi:hypothetical protein